MKLEKQTTNLVKPAFSTPAGLRNYHISFTDELAPTLNVPLILYFPALPTGHIPNILNLLQKSLSQTLTDFYPLAGRFVRSLSLVDCSDQGVRYVQAKANVPLAQLLSLREEMKADLLNNFLPCEIGEADEIGDPMLSVKVTTFECGGLVVGMCFSHRLSDMATMSMFISNWAARCRGELTEVEKHTPIFNSALFFPSKGLPELDLRIPRSSIKVKNTVQRLSFTRKAISAMREKLGFKNNGGRMPSKVQLVVAMLWKAFVRIDGANNGKSKASFLIQPLGLRDKVVPQLPTNSFGNFWGLATAQLGPGEGDNLGFQGFFEVLRGSIKKSATDCAKILTHGEEGSRVIIDPYMESNRCIADEEVNFYLFTSWCNFTYYEANFGWGKPIWASTGKLPAKNLVIMLDDEEGEGVEAWVHLDEENMRDLKQDLDVKLYAVF